MYHRGMEINRFEVVGSYQASISTYRVRGTVGDSHAAHRTKRSQSMHLESNLIVNVLCLRLIPAARVQVLTVYI